MSDNTKDKAVVTKYVGKRKPLESLINQIQSVGMIPKLRSIKITDEEGEFLPCSVCKKLFWVPLAEIEMSEPKICSLECTLTNPLKPSFRSG